jgi:RHS repeat-associated protein
MEYDSVSGQYYDRARYYDEAIGRFMAQDPIGFAGGTEDLYEYVGNDPINETDPSGLVPVPPAIKSWINHGNQNNVGAAKNAWAEVAAYVKNVETDSRNWEAAHRDLTSLKNFQGFLDKYLFPALAGNDAYNFLTGIFLEGEELGDLVMEAFNEQLIENALQQAIDDVIHTEEGSLANKVITYATAAFNNYHTLKYWISKFNSLTGDGDLTIADIRVWLGFSAKGYY